jgi:hypothetical protein
MWKGVYAEAFFVCICVKLNECVFSVSVCVCVVLGPFVRV